MKHNYVSARCARAHTLTHIAQRTNFVSYGGEGRCCGLNEWYWKKELCFPFWRKRVDFSGPGKIFVPDHSAVGTEIQWENRLWVLRLKPWTYDTKWCLMSSDVGWHIRDKLRPVPKHGSINLYVHRSHWEGSSGRTPRLSHSSWTDDDDDVGLHVLGCRVDILGTNPERSVMLSCCLTSTEARWPIRDGDRVGRGRESERLDRGNRPKKTGETVDRRQNNGSVKAVSPRHCPATCALTARVWRRAERAAGKTCEGAVAQKLMRWWNLWLCSYWRGQAVYGKWNRQSDVVRRSVLSLPPPPPPPSDTHIHRVKLTSVAAGRLSDPW